MKNTTIWSTIPIDTNTDELSSWDMIGDTIELMVFSINIEQIYI